MNKKWAIIFGILAVAGVLGITQHVLAQQTFDKPSFRSGSNGPALFGSVNAEDQDLGPRLRGPRGVRMDQASGMRGLEELDLTETQQSQLRDLRNTFGKEVAQLRADVEVAQIELREVLQILNPSESAASAQASKVTAARAKIFERTVIFRVQAKNVLTDEQKKKLQDRGRLHRPDDDGRTQRGDRGFRRGFRGGSPNAPRIPGF
jgi:Spy/CpxP family protein refolding chaperone